MILVLLTYKVDIAEIDALRPAHVDWLKQGVADGRLAVAGRKVPVRYRDSSGNTWTGRGKRRGWLVKELSSGRKMEDFLVA